MGEKSLEEYILLGLATLAGQVICQVCGLPTVALERAPLPWQVSPGETILVVLAIRRPGRGQLGPGIAWQAAGRGPRGPRAHKGARGRSELSPMDHAIVHGD